MCSRQRAAHQVVVHNAACPARTVQQGIKHVRWQEFP